MGWTFALLATELESFRRCRRAWDFGSRTRRRWVPLEPPDHATFDRAVHDALGVYYLPAMDDWSRAIVRPLAIAAFRRRMGAARDRAVASGSWTRERERDWTERERLGERVLGHFFAWAVEVDDFDSILSDHELWVGIPDPTHAGEELVTPDGWPIRYSGRVDLLISTGDDESWVVTHRLVDGPFADGRTWIDDWIGRTFVWGMRAAYPQLRILGNVYDEIRLDVDPATAPPSGPPRDRPARVRRVNRRRDYLTPLEDASADEPHDAIVRLDGTERFRRTYVRRSRESVARVAIELAADAATMTVPGLGVPPRPSPESCAPCPYRAPCEAIEAGADAAPILARAFRRLAEDEPDDPGRRRAGPASPDRGSARNVRGRWG